MYSVEARRSVTTRPDDDRERLDQWLALLHGPGHQGQEARDRAVREMQSAGADRLFPLLSPLLTDPEPDTRCRACETVLRVDARRGVELVLPLLHDPAVEVRWHASGCLHDFGDERAIDPLIRVLQGDPDPQVRGTAAYALGGIGSPAAIPALLAALKSDHEVDELGHTPSSCAATALDDILGTHETRIRRADGLCTMQRKPPNREHLEELARATYLAWARRQAEQGTTAVDGTPGA